MLTLGLSILTMINIYHPAYLQHTDASNSVIIYQCSSRDEKRYKTVVLIEYIYTRNKEFNPYCCFVAVGEPWDFRGAT